MRYENTTIGIFLARPNRFLAEVELDGRVEHCHVKNTGRLWELLLPGVRAVVQKAANPGRKTPYDLIAVEHRGFWVNIDSQAPNRVFGEWLRTSEEFGAAGVLRPETRYGRSRFDYYIEMTERKIFAEVKGVTLVEDGVARFPGAPTLRGVKHLEELGACLGEGYEAMVAFIIQRLDVHRFAPNDTMHPAFGAALRAAAQKGVRVLALGCEVTANTLSINRSLEVLL
ncbi:DNA/RNA nuclease SfsA [Ruminococcaceae bacterium OttesenSCG-928-D13]|nr:DNA/RNA nuclease SfsA [Ruminococcaceae bacterium OttesenSCG-928-D13]